MFNILTAIYHDDPIVLSALYNLENPETAEERRVAAQLRAVDEKAAEALKSSIDALVDSQSERVFYSGVRFGAQLMAQLLAAF